MDIVVIIESALVGMNPRGRQEGTKRAFKPIQAELQSYVRARWLEQTSNFRLFFLQE